MYVTTMTAIFLWIANQTCPASPPVNGKHVNASQDTRMVVLIDPGHGGSETGACSQVTHECEKKLTLELGLQLRSRLEARRIVRVEMTRTTDEHVPLYDRSAQAQKRRADLFVSIHVNASQSHRERGFETYLYPDMPRTIDSMGSLPPNPDSRAFAQWNVDRVAADLGRRGQRRCSVQFGDLVESGFRHALGRRFDRGLKEKELAVLAGLDVPGVLVEVGFADHPIEGRLLMDPAYRRRIVEVLARAIETWSKLGRQAGCLRSETPNHPAKPAPHRTEAEPQEELPNLPELPTHMTRKERAGLLTWRT